MKEGSKSFTFLHSKFSIFIFAIFIYVVHFLYFHGGYFGYDDIEYCRLANSFLKDDYEHSSLYAFRYAPVGFLALLYSLIGIGDLANFLSMFLVFCGIFFIFIIGIKDLSWTAKWIASSFLILAPMHLMYMEKPMPDMLVELGFLMAFLSYFSLRFELHFFKHPALLFIFGVIVMFLSKETFLIFYPFFLGLLTVDVLRKRNTTFWKTVVVSLSIFIIIYFGFCYFYFGNPLARIQNIYAGQYASACSYDSLPISAVINRISYQLWSELCRNLFLIPLAFIPYILKQGNEKQIFVVRSFVSLLVLANFMTISYTSYVPLCPDPRHDMFILPLAAMIIGYGINNINNASLSSVVTSCIILLTMCFVSAYMNYENTWWLYLPLILSIICGYYGKKSLMVLLFGFGMFSVFSKNVLYNYKINYKDQKGLNDYVIYRIPGKKYAITDRVNNDYGMLHSRFDSTIVQFVDYTALDTIVLKNEVPQYIIVNGMTSYLSNTSWESLPEFARTAHEKLPKVYENKSGVVYKLR